MDVTPYKFKPDKNCYGGSAQLNLESHSFHLTENIKLLYTPQSALTASLTTNLELIFTDVHREHNFPCTEIFLYITILLNFFSRSKNVVTLLKHANKH